MFKSRSQRRFKMLVNICPDHIFWTPERFVAKPGMDMDQHEPECHAEKLVHCVQCQGHSMGLYDQNMTISVVSSKLLVHLQPNLVWWYSIISLSVLWKNGITAFKAKGTAKVQNVSECLEDIFWITEHFATKYGMVMQYHEPECHAKFCHCCYL